MIPKQIGEILFDLAPDKNMGNPRNSEGSFIELSNGNILFIYSRFRGNLAEDYATSDICMLILNEKYDIIDSKVILRCEDENAINIMSTSLLRLDNSDICLFYLVRESRSSLKMYLRKSSDEGKSWGERKLCTKGDDVFVVNNDRVHILSNGRIIIPVAAHKVENMCYNEFAQMTFFFSDDNGDTWKEVEKRVTMPPYSVCKSGLQEPGVVELKNGELYAWARTDLGRQYQSCSHDYGEHWEPCSPSKFTSPNSPMSIKKMKDDTFIAVWNPIPEYNGRPKKTDIFLGGRCPLVLAVSRDGGKTFSEPVAVETDDNHGYCYCSMYFAKDSLLLAYCAGGIEDGSCLSRCRIRRIDSTEIEKI